jgi:hypothetical protein
MVTESVSEPASGLVKELPPLTVLYDGACPLCRRKISVYRGLRPHTPVSTSVYTP